MEAAFSADFSSVRVHTGPAADGVASKLGAHALTAGPDILFRAGAYNPGTRSGDRLLAHELAHVVQQAGGVARAPIDGGPSDPLERAADVAAEDVVRAARSTQAPAAADLGPLHGAPRSSPPRGGGGAPPAVVQGQRVPAIQRDSLTAAGEIQLAAARACAAGPDDYSGVGPAGVTEALQGEVARMESGSDPVASLDLFQRIWMTFGQAAAEIYIYHLLKRMWIQGDRRSVDQFVDRFVYRIGLHYDARRFGDDPAVRRVLAIGGTVLAQQKRLHAESERFITCFEEQATQTAYEALDESKQRVIGELKHYFGSSWIGIVLGSTGVTEAEDEASRRALGIAAQGLAKRRNALIEANAAYRNAVGNRYLTWADRKPIEEAQAHADDDYEIFRKQVVPLFPILEEVSSPAVHPFDNQDAEPDDKHGGQLAVLAQLAQGGESEDASRFIRTQVADKLTNIDEIREELEPGGEVNVWKVPKIVEATSELTGATHGTFYGKLVEDKVNEESPRSLTERLIEIVEIGLYVAALFTEGATLIPAVMITTGRVSYRVYEHWKEYRTQKALHGTDFGALALSADDPSLFWLGADLAAAFVEVGLSVVPAFEVFRALAPAARAARAARAGEEAIVALETAARELTTKELGAEKAAQFAARVAADARAAQRGTTVGMTSEEARMLAEAEAQAAEAAAKRAAAGAKGIPAATGGARAGGHLPVGASLPSRTDRVLGAAVESKLAKAGATDALEAARSAMRAGNTAEAERLFVQMEGHLTAEEANLLWRDLGNVVEAATRLEQPITLLGERHLLKMVQGQDGAFFVLCSWCTRVRDVLRQALEKATQEGAAAARTSRLQELIRQVEQMEANLTWGKIGRGEATSTNTMRTLLGKLTEGEHLIGSTLRELPARSTPNFTGLARDPGVASRAAELYEGYLGQLWEARRDIFGRGKQVRDQLWKELEKEAQARALTQAQRESVRGVPLELAPGAPARVSVDPRVDIPFGFYDRSGFEQFSQRLNATLRAPDAKLIIEGSAVTGRRYERIAAPFGPTGSPFGMGRLSDYDIAIVSDSLFMKAKNLKMPLSGDALATRELDSAGLAKLGLADLETAAREGVLAATGIAYPVKFQIRPANAPAKLGLPLAGGGK